MVERVICFFRQHLDYRCICVFCCVCVCGVCVELRVTCIFDVDARICISKNTNLQQQSKVFQNLTNSNQRSSVLFATTCLPPAGLIRCRCSTRRIVLFASEPGSLESCSRLPSPVDSVLHQQLLTSVYVTTCSETVPTQSRTEPDSE
jgi:hypothetical protein